MDFVSNDFVDARRLCCLFTLERITRMCSTIEDDQFLTGRHVDSAMMTTNKGKEYFLEALKKCAWPQQLRVRFIALDKPR